MGRHGQPFNWLEMWKARPKDPQAEKAVVEEKRIVQAREDHGYTLS